MNARPFGLTKRQHECLHLASEHRTSKEIAGILGLSPHTVDGHIEAARTAMKAPDRATAARMLTACIADKADRPPPNPLTAQPSPVEPTAGLEASDESQNVVSTVQRGRQIELGAVSRLGIIALVALATIYAVVLLLVGADVIARRPWSAPASTTTQR